MITISNLTYTYPDGTRALDGVSLSIAKGESVGIVGANGAGKSTLVSHLNGFLLPQDGRIAVGGTVLTKRSAEEIRRVVGVVFQNPDDQLFTGRLYDDAAFGPENLGWSREEVSNAVESVLADLGLWELRDRPPSHLSQGQKRFAAVATVLVMKPSVLVMDEPTSDLDPRHRRRLIGLVSGLSATRLIVSHDLDFIWETCDRVVVMASGRVVAEGETRAILSDETLLENNGLELPLRLQGCVQTPRA